MPIYEYACENCGNQLDVLQKISDAPLVDCSECHQPSLKKLISAAGFRLKGAGWYETDFKGKNKRNLAESSSKDSGKSSTKDQSKSIAASPVASK